MVDWVDRTIGARSTGCLRAAALIAGNRVANEFIVSGKDFKSSLSFPGCEFTEMKLGCNASDRRLGRGSRSSNHHVRISGLSELQLRLSSFLGDGCMTSTSPAVPFHDCERYFERLQARAALYIPTDSISVRRQHA